MPEAYLSSIYAEKVVRQTASFFAGAFNVICEEELTKMDCLCRRLRLNTADLQPFDKREE